LKRNNLLGLIDWLIQINNVDEFLFFIKMIDILRYGE